jgi:Spy/CpxP family protein refolding chaperone
MMARLHRRMMRSPMYRMQMNVLLLPALADTLGLTDDQLRRLEQLRTTLQNEQQEWRRQMQAKRQSFRRLMASDSLPSAEAVRTHMQTIASLRVEHQASTYAAAQSMRDVLTEEQRAAVDDLPPRRRVRLLMTHVPMMDMMQMMGPMGGGAGAWGPRMGMHRRMGRRGGRGPGR